MIIVYLYVILHRICNKRIYHHPVIVLVIGLLSMNLTSRLYTNSKYYIGFYD